MANVRLIQSEQAGAAMGAGNSFFITLANTLQRYSTTEAHRQITFNSGGVLSKGFINIPANTITTSPSTLKTRKNGANANISISITASATGLFEDLSNTDTVTVGEKWNYNLITPATSGTLTFSSTAIIFSATTDTYELFGAVGPTNSTGVNFIDNSTNYVNLFGLLLANVTESTVQNEMMNSGTLKHGFVYISANTASVTSTITTRKNSVDQTIQMSITSDATGIFEDTSNTNAVLDGENWNWKVTVPTEVGTNNLTIMMLSIGFETTNSQHILGYGDAGEGINSNLTRYFCLTVIGTSGVTETISQITSRLSNAVAKELEIEISANSVTATSTLTFRQNATTDSLSVSIGASSTGLFSATGTVTIAVDDEINHKLVTGATGTSLTTQGCNVLIDCTAAASATVTVKAQIPMVIG